MNFQETKPQNEEYWWIVDEDGEATVVFISVNDKTGNALASYIGSDATFDAKKLDYLGKAVRLGFPKPVLQLKIRDLTEQEIADIGDMSLGNSAVISERFEGAGILNEVTHNQLDREKIELADAIINLLPGNYTPLQRIKILEDAIGYTPKHVLNGENLDDVDDTAEQSKETS